VVVLVAVAIVAALVMGLVAVAIVATSIWIHESSYVLRICLSQNRGVTRTQAL
jgi:hypothetical protein